jgi:hypothetical protein
MQAFEVVNVRNGKRGKERIMRFTVVTTVFPIEFEKRPLKSDKWDNVPIVGLAAESARDNDVMSLSPLEFVGWAFAYKLYVRDSFANHGINKWPKGKEQPVNAFRHISERIRAEKAATLELLGGQAFREEFVAQMRFIESGMCHCLLSDRYEMADRRLRALAYLMWAEEKYRKGWFDLKVLKNSYEFYKGEAVKIADTLYRQEKRRYSLLPKNMKENIPAPSKKDEQAEADDVMKKIKAYVKAAEPVNYNHVLWPNKFGQDNNMFNPGLNQMFKEHDE